MLAIIPQDATPQKQCCTCKQSFSATTEFFHRHKNSPSNDGLSMRCKPCAREQTIRSRANPNRKTYPKLKGQKRCSECGEVKPATLEYFHASGKGGQGLTHVCSQCWLSYTSRLAQERLNKRQGTMCTCTGPCGTTFPFTLEYFPPEGPGLRTRCRECCREQTKANYKLNEEERKAYRRKHDDANRELVRSYTRNRVALKKKAPGSHTIEDIKRQYERQKGHCYYCGTKLGTGKRAYHADHVIPLSRGGSNDISNIVITCPHCNVSKQNKLLHEWIEGGRLL